MTKASTRRPAQVAETIRQVLAEALAREVRDPRIGLVTLTQVNVTGDLSHATVMFTSSAGPEDRERALEGLKSAAGFFRTKISKALATRTVPELHFQIDRGAEHTARINEVLAEIRKEKVD